MSLKLKIQVHRGRCVDVIHPSGKLVGRFRTEQGALNFARRVLGNVEKEMQEEFGFLKR